MTLSEPSRENVFKMFDDISPTYDLTNRVMTFNLDRRWRKKVARCVPLRRNMRVLDCATGTGDQLFSVMQYVPSVTSAVGIDMSSQMIERARQKVLDKPYADRVSFQCASALELPFEGASFDCVTISFGIRNVTNVQSALAEFVRVLKPGGSVVILEGTTPQNRVLRAAHRFYMRRVMPRIGALISKNAKAYRYLNETIETFPSGSEFCALMTQAGLTKVSATALNFGLVTIYQGERQTK